MSSSIGGHVIAARDAVIAVVVALVMAGGFAPAALADGDPASDILVSQRMFLPADAGVSQAQDAQLSSLLQTTSRDGFPIRVAVIASDYDLGSVTELWHRPRSYARFLGIELSLIHRQPLLIVMPNGLGFNWPGHSTTSAYRLLARIPVNAGGAGLLTATGAAVRALASAHGVKLAAAVETAAGAAHAGSGSGPVAEIAGAVAVLLAAVLALLLVRRRRSAGMPEPDEPPAPEAGPAPAPARRAARFRVRRTAVGVGMLCSVVAAAAILAFTRPWQTSQASAEANAPVATPWTWREGQRLAPSFRLTDQDGRPVSLAAYRGRPVIVTFVDPLCRNLCPLAAHVLNQVDRQLPASRRPVIIAVSVDVYADSRADLLQDFHRWSLVPQWRWGVGSPKQLASVWKRYQIAVSVATKRIAGTTVHFITHDEAAYVIDPSGYERALYFWPYYPQNLEHLLTQLSRT